MEIPCNAGDFMPKGLQNLVPAEGNICAIIKGFKRL